MLDAVLSRARPTFAEMLALDVTWLEAVLERVPTLEGAQAAGVARGMATLFGGKK